MRLLRVKTSSFTTIIILVIASFTLGTSLVSSSAENVTANILACINKNTGSVRISKVCSPRETPFQWLINGLTGKPGARGSQIITGTSSKDLDNKSLGEIGDYFLSTNEAILYGPKMSNGWPIIGVKLQGPAGPKGDKGDKGDSGSQGIPGLAGAPGVTTTLSSSIVRSVYDSAGTLVGELYGVYGTAIAVKVGPSIVTYGSNGAIATTGGIVYFDSNCAGKRYSMVDFENEFTTQFPLIYTPEYYRNNSGTKVYSPYAPSPIVAQVIGPLITRTSYYYADYANTGDWTCTLWTPSLSNPRSVQELQTFAPQFSLTIGVPFSIR